MTKNTKKLLKQKYFNDKANDFYNTIKSKNRLFIFGGDTKDEIIKNYIQNNLKPRTPINSNNFTDDGYVQLPKKEDTFFSDIIQMVANEKKISYSEARTLMSNFDRVVKREALDNISINARNQRIKILGR